ncbi:MAG: glycolate oxidase subunit GlcE [Burkholderiales bacterium]|nr:glycolate oxidase subunit GlcE [Burkholderiales bacterium]
MRRIRAHARAGRCAPASGAAAILSPADLAERIREAAASGRRLRLRGGGTKDFYGGSLAGEVLDTRGHAGVVAYEPSELVVTARCGTPLAELERLLVEHGQMLAFEPPHFGPGATVGGCVAAGLSGPRRASTGAVRDFVLGVRVLDGRGRELSFGGRVMKNVAGYDVARFLAGSMGTLALLLEVSLKVLPRPPAERSLRLEMDETSALEAMNRWGCEPLPISATAWAAGVLTVRLSGAQAAVRAAAAKIGGEPLAEDEARRFWEAVREQTDPFFSGDAPLWRLSVPSVASPIALAGRQLIEWGGALRWWKTAAPAAEVRAAAAKAGGHATLFRAAEKSGGAFAPLSPELEKLHRALKKVFDPAGILGPGRMYPEF